jgi:hypothetical protein
MEVLKVLMEILVVLAAVEGISLLLEAQEHLDKEILVVLEVVHQPGMQAVVEVLEVLVLMETHLEQVDRVALV